jgi:hypothetical protein
LESLSASSPGDSPLQSSGGMITLSSFHTYVDTNLELSIAYQE